MKTTTKMQEIEKLVENNKEKNNVALKDIENNKDVEKDVENPTAGASITNINEAIVAFKRECPVITKTTTVDYKVGTQIVNFNYADYGTIQQVITPVLSKFNLYTTFNIKEDDERVILICAVVYAPTQEHLESSVFISKHLKDYFQKFGSALTYLKRYLLTSLLDIPIAESLDVDALPPDVWDNKQSRDFKVTSKTNNVKNTNTYNNVNSATYNNNTTNVTSTVPKQQNTKPIENNATPSTKPDEPVADTKTRKELLSKSLNDIINKFKISKNEVEKDILISVLMDTVPGILKEKGYTDDNGEYIQSFDLDNEKILELTNHFDMGEWQKEIDNNFYNSLHSHIDISFNGSMFVSALKALNLQNIYKLVSEDVIKSLKNELFIKTKEFNYTFDKEKKGWIAPDGTFYEIK